jgi:hypothetical protein
MDLRGSYLHGLSAASGEGGEQHVPALLSALTHQSGALVRLAGQPSRSALVRRRVQAPVFAPRSARH